MNVRVERDGAVTIVIIDRPNARNAVDPPTALGLREAFEAFEADEATPIAVLTGAGDHFCSGFDLKAVSSAVGRHDPEGDGPMGPTRRLLSKPVIAAVEGYAVAGGFELMISCDFALAASEAKIGDFHIRRALFGGAGPIYRLPRMIGMRRSKELMLTGKLLTGEQCADWGLINACAPQAEFDKLIQDFCAPLIDKSPFCMWMTKMAVNRGLDADTNSLITLETMTCNVVHHSADAKEGVRAFLDKRKPEWTGR